MPKEISFYFNCFICVNSVDGRVDVSEMGGKMQGKLHTVLLVSDALTSLSVAGSH